DGLAAPARRLDDDGEVLLQLALPDELGQQPRPKADLDGVLGVAADTRVEELVTHGGPRAASARRAPGAPRPRRRTARAAPRGPRRARNRARRAPRARPRSPSRCRCSRRPGRAPAPPGGS